MIELVRDFGYWCYQGERKELLMYLRSWWDAYKKIASEKNILKLLALFFCVPR